VPSNGPGSARRTVDDDTVLLKTPASSATSSILALAMGWLPEFAGTRRISQG
jgi:hypothetical protein